MNSIDTNDLPVAACLPEILRAASSSHPVVLKAPPGAGKTTLVPLALLHNDTVTEGQILLIQPRRIAARAAASRLSHLNGTPLGKTIGYHVRFDRCASSDTKVLVLTTGMLLRRLTIDPLLENVGCVILDEFHERSSELDLALGMIERIRSTLREELKVIVMSATLEPEPIVEFFRRSGTLAIAIESAGRSYPVDIHYASSLSRQPIDRQVLDVLPNVLEQTAGHVLIFLPGVGEIKRVHRAIQNLQISPEYDVFDLYGDLTASAQDEVIRPSQRRKVILSTNVAETSVTIPGVTAVIDSGLSRMMTFRPQIGLPSLRRVPISQASADQRAGRAGRTEPGICCRLWPKAAHHSRRENDLPEIQRADFSRAAMMLSAWGERETLDFPWLTPPSQASIDQSKKLLQRMDAINDQCQLTATGQRMVALPLHPRIARFLIAANDCGLPLRSAALAAALMTERSPFSNRSQVPGLIDQIAAMSRFVDGDRSLEVSTSAAKQMERVSNQLIRTMGTKSLAEHASDPHLDHGANRSLLSRALLAAFPDRVARRRDENREKAVMVGGRGVRLRGEALTSDANLFVCIDVDDKGVDADVRTAIAIQQDWLSDHLLQVNQEYEFDPSRESVIARRREYYDDLMLSESPIQCKPSDAVAQQLFDASRGRCSELVRGQNRDAEMFLTRSRLLAKWMPELKLPMLDDDAISEVLKELCRTRTSIAELRSAPWLAMMKAKFDYSQQQQLERFAPERLVVPSGNSIRIEYHEEKPPTMRVKLQELFGWTETPTIAGGRVKIQLHLLGPNRRPQQITDDLASFWKNTYQTVRKDLRSRYPKHDWPVDPLSAKATHNGLKPRTN
ncbi:ATP-dependent RNA helicase HrpB [Novipirellula aureliae]|uniref:ATP-dependent RNA helicase HrpB n=1 Tax=Novipirellula aureliae TaxID=2527966 RepID=A0A5C6DRA5_9BACT|nr:ATP-dependent helicase HrpB [Novipirellula aureliae]TWU38745.1 ATP-dependent RNA helicase HrpB [Novipirellula aureliae]